MQLQSTERKQAKIKMALQGPTGSGITKSSLLLAYGLVQDWSETAIIDSEKKSAHFFANLCNYNVLTITPPFEPEKYVEAINYSVKKGMEVIIIDSISAEWEGSGGDITENLCEGFRDYLLKRYNRETPANYFIIISTT
jgi:hypothetical protein